MKTKTFIILISLLLYGTACSKSEQEKTVDNLLQEPIVSAERVIKGKATKVVDGDTFIFEWVEVKNGQRETRSDRVRSYGIDAPELKQAYGKQSKEYLENHILEKEFTVYVKGIDNYDRILGIAYKSGKDINLETIKAGYAWHFKKYDKTPSYAEAEQKARTQKNGLWKGKNPKAPWKWRAEHLNVSRLQYYDVEGKNEKFPH